MKKVLAALGLIILLTVGAWVWLRLHTVPTSTALSSGVQVARGHLAFSYIPPGWKMTRSDDFGFVAQSPDYQEAPPDPKTIPPCPKDSQGRVSEGCATNYENELAQLIPTKGASLWYSVQPACVSGSETIADFETRSMRNNPSVTYIGGFKEQRITTIGMHQGILAAYTKGYSLLLPINGDCQDIVYRVASSTAAFDAQWGNILQGIAVVQH